jgi:uroporphyrinogen decarboxylase
MNIAMGLVAKVAGVSFREYVQDYRKLVEGNLICAERFGFDSVGVISDPMREASAYGAVLIFPEEGVPYSDPPLLASGIDPKKLNIPDPLDSPRTLDRIKGVELFKQKVHSDYPIIGWVEGVMAETADLRGVNALMYDLVDEDSEDALIELMDIIFSQQCRFALEQIKAGADVIGVGNAVASLVGPSLYEKFGQHYDKKLVRFIKDNGALVKLHICGNISAIMPLLIDVAPDILDIDWMVDLKTASEVFSKSSVSVCGNINPVAVLYQGDAELIEQKVMECKNINDKTLLIAAGCEIPAATPEQNLLLMDKLLYIR